MPMVLSGNVISLGGNVVLNGLNESAEYELYQTGHGYNSAGNAAISLNDSSVRTMARVSSGAISFSDLYGKSGYLEQHSIIIGSAGYSDVADYGYNSLGYIGTCIPSTSTIYGGATILGIYEVAVAGGFSETVFSMTGAQPNSGWTNLILSGAYANGTPVSCSYARTNATYNVYPSNSPPQTVWSFTGGTSVFTSLYLAGVVSATASFT